ncbi:hypothetical protein REPUB_Repub06bG0096300 [Reevesia pubescens]
MSEGIMPNEVTFIGVLTACGHTGLVEEGCRYLRLMKEVYGIKPGVEHFTCMVSWLIYMGELLMPDLMSCYQIFEPQNKDGRRLQKSHPQKDEIYAYLDKLIGRLREIGFLSNAKLVMQDMEEEQGEMLLGFQSEKLATAYGIISTTSQTPIHIMKNLQVCNDCQILMKYTSKLLDREIIVRDIGRFHHFKHGCLLVIERNFCNSVSYNCFTSVQNPLP